MTSPFQKKKSSRNIFLALQHYLVEKSNSLFIQTFTNNNLLIFVGNIMVQKKNIHFSKEAQIFGQSTHWPFSLS